MLRGRHMPFYLAALAAVMALLSALWLPPLLVTVVAANAFFATYLALTVIRIPRLSPAALHARAGEDDIPAWIIFLIAFGAVTSALAALFIMLNAARAAAGWPLLLAFSAVPLGWMTIHMMAAIHYAHLYWRPGDGNGPARGLEFPKTPEPGGIEFVYFAFVIGMTAQTSDVTISTAAMRRVNVAHAVVSFFFNTVLVAAAVNAAVTLSN